MKREITYRHLAALKNGNTEVFKFIYDRYHSLIFFYILKFVKQKTLAEEATVDVFTTIWKKRKLINPDLPFQAFLYKIAKDTAYNYLKKIATNTRLKQQYNENYPVQNIKNGELIFLEKEQMGRLNLIIENLPPKRLEVFKLRYYQGKDNKTIAQQLGISINTVKVHLAKARLFLKERTSIGQYLYWVLLELIVF